MESTSEVVQLKEQASSTLSSTVTKKCVQELSATSIKEISSLLQAKEGGGIVIEDPNKLVGNKISNNVIKLMYPDDANTINTSSRQNEFVAMAIKDEHGNDIGQLTQQNQEEQSVKSSTSVSMLDGGNTISSLTQLSSASSLSLAKQIATTSVVVEAQETSTSSSSSKTVTDKNDHVNEHPEPKNESVEVEETITIKKRVEEVSEDVKEDQTNDEDGEASEQVITVTSIIEKEQSESSSADEEEIVEDSIDENEKSVSKSVTEKVTESTIDSPNGNGSKTIKETTVTQETPNGTKTVVTTTTITKETPTTTTIITTPSTPTKEETFVEEKIVEEAEDEEEDGEDDSEQEEDEVKEVDKLNENNEADRTVVEETTKKEQVQPPEPPQQSDLKEETIVDAPSSLTHTNQLNINIKQDNINNTLKDIISSIDSNIIAEENIAALKEREIELIKKQQELAKEIQQQQIIAQKLAKDNQFKQEEMNNKFNSGNNESFVAQKAYQPINNMSKYSTYEDKQDENMYTRKSETFETRESTNVSKKIDLHKIFTPATDAEEIIPKNRKLYASSAFYSPTLHPTVEDQVELARRISHSLSDISNQQSRGQSMYVNRKKRSVKWVHEGCGQEEPNETTLDILNNDENKEEGNKNNVCHLEKVPLKFLMNPHGQMRDINSLRESLNTETGLLSPDVSVEVVTALQTHKGKGAELFAKRRKVSEKWVVDENNVGAQSPSGLPDYHQYQTQPKPSTSPSILPAYTDVAKHRVQLNLHQEQLMEKYAKPGLKVVQTPWEAALNSGSASTAFVEESNLSPCPTSILTPSPTPQIYDTNQGGVHQQSPTSVADIYNKPSAKDDYTIYQPTTKSYHLPQVQSGRQQYSCTNSQRELAYKPSIPQGWKVPGMSLPKVEFESQIQNETELKTNEIRLAVNEAARFCEEFNTKDEKEIINLIGDVKESEISSTASQLNLLSVGVHQFVNHLVKSPELKVSPIPIATQLILDNAVQELAKKRERAKEKCEINRAPDVPSDENCDNIVEDSERKVNVRKQLQQYEDLHKQFAKKMQQEQLLLKKHESAKVKALINYKKKSNNDKSAVSIQGSEQGAHNESTEEPQEYVQIPIKELIINFEQQCRQEKSNDASLPQTLNNNTYCCDSDTTKEINARLDSHNEDLYMPKEIPIQSYAPPPTMAIPPSVSPFSSNADYEIKRSYENKSTNAGFTAPYLLPESLVETKKSFGSSNTFPINKPYQQGFSSTFGHTQPPKQQYLPPQSYQTVSQNSNQNVPQVNFNPSPLPYDKLAKFENPPTDNSRHAVSPNRNYHLNVRGSKVRNTSPAPFAGSYQRPYTPTSDSYNYGTPTSSPRPNSSFGLHSSNPCTNISNSQILNAPTYNSLARGWGCSGIGSNISTGYQAARNHVSTPIKYPSIVNAASIPYTDF